MQRFELEHLIRAADAIADDTEIVVIGSQAVLGQICTTNEPFMRKPKTIPKFANEKAERTFWEKHDSTAYLDWKQAQRAVLPNLKPTTKTISLRLPQHLLNAIKAARQRARCAISITDQGMAAGEATYTIDGVFVDIGGYMCPPYAGFVDWDNNPSFLHSDAGFRCASIQSTHYFRPSF